jgi:hypothetical protein
MGGLKIKKAKECHVTSKIFSPMDGKKKNDMESTFVVRGNKSAQFFSPLEF